MAKKQSGRESPVRALLQDVIMMRSGEYPVLMLRVSKRPLRIKIRSISGDETVLTTEN